MDHSFSEPLHLNDAYDVPLKEVDPKVTEKTFCIVNKNWGQYYVYRFSQSPSLFLFYPFSSLRQAAISFTTHIGYDVLLLFVVLGNLIDLASPDLVPFYFDYISMLFYIMETIYQSISRGFIFGSYSYLRNPWMCFDFVVTLSSFVHVSSSAYRKDYNGTSLRGLRIFNIITRVPGVRSMAYGTVKSLSRALGVTVMFLLFLISTTLASQIMFKGSSWQKCVKAYQNDSKISYKNFISDRSNWLVGSKPIYFFTCGNVTSARYCPEGYVCLPDMHLNTKTSSFDDFGSAFMNSFSLMTHEDWDTRLEEVTKSTGYSINFFFVPIVYLGSYFLNLMLVIVISAYTTALNFKQDESIGIYTYGHYFKFDVTKLSLELLPTNKETITTIIKRGSEMREHNQVIKRTVKEVFSFITLKYFQKFIKRPTYQERQLVIQKSRMHGFLSVINKFHFKVKWFTYSKGFQYFILISMIMNVIFEACDHEGISKAFEHILMIGDRVFVTIYSFEMVCKIISQGLFYFLSWWNIFDAVVLAIAIKETTHHEKSYATIMKSLRLLKQLEVQTKWIVFQRLTTVILNSILDVFRLMIITFLSIFVFAIVGHKILGDTVRLEGYRLEWSFRSFEGSLFTVFRLFTGEWSDEYLRCIDKSGYPLCSVFFVTYFFLGNLVIMNLFTALLISLFRISELGIPLNKGRIKSELYSTSEETDVFREEASGNINESEPRSLVFYVRKIVGSIAFQYTMYAVIICNCIMLCFHDDSLEEDSEWDRIFSLFSQVFTVIFLLEMVLKWIGWGYKAYFSSWWLCLDFFVNMAALLEIFLVDIFDIMTHTGFGAFRALKTLPLTAHWKGMRIVIEALVLSTPAIMSLLPLLLLIWIPFSIFAMHKFRGQFYRCSDEHNFEVPGLYGKDECLEKNYYFQNPFFNFDNILSSFLSLTKLALLADWDQIAMSMMNKSINSEGNDGIWRTYLFVVAFILIGGLFCSNLFIGAAVDNFQRLHAYVEHGVSLAQLNEQQKKYFRALKAIGLKRPSIQIRVPTNALLLIFFKITQAFWFRAIIFVTIWANAVIVGLNSYHTKHAKVFKTLLLVFPAIYILEFIIKLLGMRKYLLNDVWNRFDFIIYLSCLIGLFMELVMKISSPWMTILCVLRIFRTINLLNMFNFYQGLRILIHVMASTLPFFLHITYLFLLIIFIYAILGMSMFANVRPFAGVTIHVNFKRFYSSFLLLFRLSTVDGWEEILNPMGQQPPFCDPETNCGKQVLAVIFVLTFIFLTYVLLMNMFVVIMLERYNEAYADEKEIFKLNNLISFYLTWSKFNPDATHYILLEDLSEFLDSLETELQIPKPNEISIAYMDLPIEVGNKIHCLNVLKGIMKIKYGEVLETPEFRLIRSAAEKNHLQKFPELKVAKLAYSSMEWKAFDRSARIIQGYLKLIKAAKKRSSRISLHQYLKSLEVK